MIEVTYAGDTAALLGQGTSYALLIANQTYGGATGMPGLATPFADLDAVARLLTQRYGFVTEARLPDGTLVPLILKDATRAQIETALFQLSRVAGEKDKVLVWYGGHGIFEQMTDTAFWVPADAVAGVPPSYLSASAISEALLRLQAGAVIVVSDSCYSARFASARAEGAAPASVTEDDRSRMLQRLAARRSRVLLTSARERTRGRWRRRRAFHLCPRLPDRPDRGRGPVTAQELFDGWVRPIVIGRAEQEPQFRPIAKSGHEGGDFVFVPRP